jgi:regulatory protein
LCARRLMLQSMKKRKSPDAGAPGARDAALRLLARRSHTCAELACKLGRRGHAPQDVSRVVEELSQAGYVNDAVAALRWVEILVHRSFWGRRKIAAYLARRGIERECAEQAQRAVWQQCSEEDIARKALHKRFAGASAPPAPEKVLRFLQSQGFSSDVMYALAHDMSGDAQASSARDD